MLFSKLRHHLLFFTKRKRGQKMAKKYLFPLRPDALFSSSLFTKPLWSRASFKSGVNIVASCWKWTRKEWYGGGRLFRKCSLLRHVFLEEPQVLFLYTTRTQARSNIPQLSPLYNRTLHPSLARQSHIPSLLKQNESPVELNLLNNGSIHRASNTTLPHPSGRIDEWAGLVRIGH